jgi:hypothetical protein
MLDEIGSGRKPLIAPGWNDLVPEIDAASAMGLSLDALRALRASAQGPRWIETQDGVKYDAAAIRAFVEARTRLR